MIGNTGLLSQSLINLANLRKSMASITNLPPAAQGIQQTSIKIFEEDEVMLKDVQSRILSFTPQIEPIIKLIIEALKTGPITPEEIKAVEDINTQASDMGNYIQGKSIALNSSKEQLISLNNSLATVKNTLQGDINSLSVEIDSANREVDSLNQRKYYLIALGPFGLVGLAVIIGLLVDWNNKINDLNSRNSAMGAQINMLNTLINNVNSMMSNFNTSVGLVSNIKNGIDFLSADIKVVIDDLRTADGKLAQVYLTAALQQIQTLAIDAS